MSLSAVVDKTFALECGPKSIHMHSVMKKRFKRCGISDYNYPFIFRNVMLAHESIAILNHNVNYISCRYNDP